MIVRVNNENLSEYEEFINLKIIRRGFFSIHQNGLRLNLHGNGKQLCLRMMTAVK